MAADEPVLSTEELGDLFEHAPCGYLLLKPDGRLFKANATFCRWLDYSPEDLVGKKLHDFLNVAGRIYFETHFAPLLRIQGHFNEVALDFVTKSGQRIPVLVNAVERKSDSGDVEVIRVTVFNSTDRRRYESELLAAKAQAETANNLLRDLNATLEARVAEAVSQQLRAEEAQRQMQKMEAVGQLTGGIAHDFNNMLASVMGALSLIERRLRRGEDVGDLIAGAMDSAQRSAELTRRLLAFSRLAPLDPRVVHPNRLVSDMSEILLRALGETIELETVLAGGLWPVCTDPSQLENVVLNLAINARDAMPGGGKITVETANTYLDDDYAALHAETRPGQYVMVAVTDNGAGMTADIAAKAFEPFFTTKPLGKGTGLGLSQIYGYVKQERGHVKIYSEVGQGTTVKVYLPRYTGPGEPSHAKPASLTSALRGKPSEHILVVEDDTQVRVIAAENLRELGFTVSAVSSPADALALLRGDKAISLLFTDVVMPGMNGRELADQAQAMRPGLRVLFATGYTRNAIIHNGVLDAGVHVLLKPYSVDQLVRKMRQILDERG
jgi:PAS domain S-box-containing protein